MITVQDHTRVETGELKAIQPRDIETRPHQRPVASFKDTDDVDDSIDDASRRHHNLANSP
jgi:hypothetical protein